MAYSLISGFFQWLTYKEPLNILLIGLESAGKSSILEVLERDQTEASGSPSALPSPRPTVGLNLGALTVKARPLCIWDLGGAAGLRSIWAEYFAETHVIVFVVDAARRERFAEARAELERVLASPQLEGAPLLVLAHKHDAPSAADAGAVGAALGLGAVASDSDESSQSRRSVVLETSCTDAQGLFAALDWALGARAR